MIPKHILDPIIRNALAEDLGPGDVTTMSVLSGTEIGAASVVAKRELVVAGLDVFREVFHTVDPYLEFTLHYKDGSWAAKGDILAQIKGSLTAILMAERTALNFLQHMSGIATTTRRFVQAVEGTGVRILDTRKTTPGLRVLDKEAVRIGGGFNHRHALYDGVLIKENHAAAVGGIGNAVRKARTHVPHTQKVEVEVGNIDEVRQAIEAGADIIMLDNMGLEEMKLSVNLINRRAVVEASGNVSLDSVKKIAQTGVDLISVGTLTHSVTAADISLLIESKQ
jgi:nicotinate-nucleotide pyrophosphorylase (carboxylating)